MDVESKYKVVTAESLLEMERNVNEAIISGWAPKGGFSVVYNSSTKILSYFQALSKEKIGVEK